MKGAAFYFKLLKEALLRGDANSQQLFKLVPGSDRGLDESLHNREKQTAQLQVNETNRTFFYNIPASRRVALQTDIVQTAMLTRTHPFDEICVFREGRFYSASISSSKGSG